jgi:hypothetical protein
MELVRLQRVGLATSFAACRVVSYVAASHVLVLDVCCTGPAVLCHLGKFCLYDMIPLLVLLLPFMTSISGTLLLIGTGARTEPVLQAYVCMLAHQVSTDCRIPVAGFGIRFGSCVALGTRINTLVHGPLCLVCVSALKNAED